MAEKDIAGKILEDHNDVFADICNTLVFGKNFLDESKLESGPTESFYKAETGELKEQMRDVLKSYKDLDMVLCSIGMENQTTIDGNMPVRVMGYDYSSYRRQLDNGGKLHPVMTIVLNFSDKRWDKPKNLHGLMDIPEKIRPFVQDYSINVFDIAFLEDDVLESFTSDFKIVAGFFKAKRTRDAEGWPGKTEECMRHPEATMEMLKVFSGDITYKIVYEKYMKKRVENGESINMCEFTELLKKEGREEGREIGREEGQFELSYSYVKDGFISVEQAASKLNMTVEEFEEKAKAFEAKRNK